ncbi:MAG: hypothetical protein Q4E05_00905 [Pseudoclavibacter sp.]|nr:hypothetical protein [Pseudoclavibacter sp.]
MILEGERFGVELPLGWRVRESSGARIAESPSGAAPLRGALVLREWRLRTPRPTALADVSHAAMLEFPRRVPGARIVHVESLVGPLSRLEHRRIWGLVPLPAAGGSGTAVLVVHEIAVAGEAVAEVTMTIPPRLAQARRLLPVPPEPGSYPDPASAPPEPMSLQDLLTLPGSTGLVRLPDSRSARPAVELDVPAAELDEWATARDGAPRERIPAHPDGPLRVFGLDVLLPETAMRVFESALSAEPRAGRPLLRTGGPQAAALHEAGLLDERGRLSSAGLAVAELRRAGSSWTLGVAAGGEGPHGWMHGADAVAVLPPRPEEPREATRRLVHCPVEDLSRIVLHWSGHQAGWALDFRLPPLPYGVVRGKEGRSAPFPLPGGVRSQFSIPALPPPFPSQAQLDERARSDAAEFARAPWREFRLDVTTGAEAAKPLRWVQTSGRGTAWLEGGSHRALLASQPELLPHWERVFACLCPPAP